LSERQRAVRGLFVAAGFGLVFLSVTQRRIGSGWLLLLPFLVWAAGRILRHLTGYGMLFPMSRTSPPASRWVETGYQFLGSVGLTFQYTCLHFAVLQGVDWTGVELSGAVPVGLLTGIWGMSMIISYSVLSWAAPDASRGQIVRHAIVGHIALLLAFVMALFLFFIVLVLFFTFSDSGIT